MNETSLTDAEKLAKDKFSLPAPSSKSQLGITSRLGLIFKQKRVGTDGKPLFKDHGEWGSYEGDVDESGKRQGRGKMTYDSGSYYEGGFVDDKYHGDKGVYHWSDGDEYSGEWKDGERHGKGSFKNADGSVEYSMYGNGVSKGDGVAWSADRKTAHKMSDGEKKNEISSTMAEKLAKEKFDLPVPEPSTVSPPSAAVPASSKNIGFFGRLFSNRKIGPNGKMLFKDYGEWGSYEGDVDETGNRQGKGKMTYVSGNYYEGGFVNDKFHCDKGVYHWSDGDEYSGEWKDGERHGKGSFKNAVGSVEYSMYENGQAKGEGVRLSPDGKTAHTLLDGEKKLEILIEEAESLIKEKLSLSGPVSETSK